MKKLKYSHPSVPPQGVKVDEVYTLENLQKHLSLDKIKMLFEPINFKWSNKKNAKKVVVEKDN